MKYELFKQVALAVDIPEHNLKSGDIATVVDYFPASETNKENGYALEFFNAIGDTILVTALAESALASLTEDEILSVRHRLAEAA